MPIQNAGTLLENIVLLESARLLLRETGGDGRPLDIANAFAMPVFSEWRLAEKYVRHSAFNTNRLTRVLNADAGEAGAYPALLQRCLRARPGQGPNGALLVALLAGLEGRALRLWLNDLPDDAGHYPGALASLERLAATVEEILGAHTITAVRVCPSPYPASLDDLSAALRDWDRQQSPCARLGFLDPMRYTTAPRDGPQTSPKDHCDWLRRLREGGEGPALAVHFTGNSMTADLWREIASLAEDGRQAGYPSTRGFKTRHYVASVSCYHPDGPRPAAALAGRLVKGVEQAWRGWHRAGGGTESRFSPLRLLEDGQRVGPEAEEDE
jgi:hypothetical protein